MGYPHAKSYRSDDTGRGVSACRLSFADFFHNPIAGPFVLGISSGAKMIVALVMVFLLGNAIRVSSLAMIAAAFLGAMLSMGFVLIIQER